MMNRTNNQIILEKIKQSKNKVILIGTIISPFSYSHRNHDEKIYEIQLAVERFSGCIDIIPIKISEYQMNINRNYIGYFIEVKGEMQSYNLHKNIKTHLLISVHAEEIYFAEEDLEYKNVTYLNGYICKKPIYRITPLGREITDIILAVKQPHGKTNYIPCIAWGSNARYAANLNIGCDIQIIGRVQSREYTKIINENEYEQRIAYEVSISDLIANLGGKDENYRYCW